jgi:vitamin B12 transporter
MRRIPRSCVSTLSRLLLFCTLGAPGAAGAQAQAGPYSIDTLRVSVASRLGTSLFSANRTVQVLDEAQIRRMPARSIAEVLAWATSSDVLARSPAQADVTLRGATAEQVLVLVDGVRMSDRQTAHFALDLAVPLDQVERIEILRGPASAVHGADAVGGVINIVTRSGHAPRVAMRADAGSFAAAAGSTNVSAAFGGLHTDAGAEYRRADGARPGTDYRIAQGRARLSTLLSRRPVSLDVGYASRDFGARAFYTSPTAPFDEYEETRTATALLAWAADPQADFTIEPRISVRRHDDMFVLRRTDPAFYRNQHRSWQTGAELVTRAVLQGFRLATGGEAYSDVLRSSSLGDREETRAAVFTEVALNGSRMTQLNFGLRYDWHSRFGSFIAPSAAASVTLNPLLRMRTSIGRAFRAPSWTERYYNDPANVGDPELGPERAFESELAIDVGGGRGPQLSFTGFLRTTDGLIDWIKPLGASSTTPWRAQSVRNATFRGVEVEARAIDPLDTHWALSVSGIGFTSDGREASQSKYALRPITQSVQLAGERQIAGPVALTVRAAHIRRSGDRSYQRADVRIQTVLGRARAYADVLNLSDTEYNDVSGLPAPGRSFHAGLEWTLR